MNTYVLDARTGSAHFPGIGRYVTNLSRSLGPLLDPHEKLVVLSSGGIAGLSGNLELRVEESSPFGLEQQWRIPRLLRDLDAAVYHSTYFMMPYFHRVPTILTVYDLISLQHPEWVSARARVFFRLAFGMALRASHRVVTDSESALRELVNHFPSWTDRSSAIVLAADPWFRPQSAHAIEEVRSKHSLPDRYVLYFGSNKPHKNLVRLVEVWPFVTTNDAVLVIAGAWDGRYPEAKVRASALGIDGRVRFLGPLREEDLPGLYCGAEVFVFPSLHEGFGLPVLEAMACGLPVICSEISTLREVAGDAAVFFDPTKHQAIADSLNQFLRNPDLGKRFRDLGLRNARRFSWERAAKQTLEVYRSLVR